MNNNANISKKFQRNNPSNTNSTTIKWQFFEKVNSFLATDSDRLEQWNELNILPTASRKANFDDKNMSFYKTTHGFWQVKNHLTGDVFSPLQYANQFLNFTGNLNDFVGYYCLKIGNLEDYLSNTFSEETVSKRIKKAKEDRKKKGEKQKEPKIKKSTLHFEPFTEKNKTYFLEKGNISETTAKKFLKKVSSIDLYFFSSSKTNTTKKNNVFAVEIIKNECYRVLDKDSKKVYFLPNLEVAKEKIDNDFVYSFGLNELRANEPAILCGGEMDCLALLEKGYNAFTLGGEVAKLPNFILNKLKNKGITEITICYDTDFTGVSNGFALSKEKYDITFRLITLPKLPKQEFKFDKTKKKFINAFTKEETSRPPLGAITEKPSHNDICDYISLYGFDFDLMKSLTKNWNVIRIGRYIDDVLTNNFIVAEAISSQKTVLINSDMNTGKSTAIVKMAKFFNYFLNKKIIFCTQRNILASSESSKHNKLLYIGNTFEENAAKLEIDIQNNDILYCNADNVKRLVALCQSLKLDFHIVIDEPHLLSSDSLMKTRQKVVREVFDIIATEKTILLTGTPKEMIFDSQIVKFDFISSKKKVEIETTLLVEPSKNNRLQEAINLLIDAHKQNKNAILAVDSMETIRQIQTRLKKENIGVGIFASTGLEKKEEEFFNEVKTSTKDGFYFKDFQHSIILATSVVSVGFNIYTDKPAVIINLDISNSKEFDEANSLQLQNRIRNNDTSLKDNFKVDYYVITNFLNQLNDTGELEKTDIKRAVEKAEYWCNIYNTENEALKTESKFVKDCFKTKPEFITQNLITWNKEIEKFVVDYAAIQEQIEGVLRRNGSPLVHKPSKIIYPSQALDQNLEEVEEKTEQAIEEVIQKKKEDRELIAHLYSNLFCFLCKCVSEKTKNPKLRSKTKGYAETQNWTEEDKNTLTGSQLVIAEKLLKNHFTLFKLVEDTEKVKSVLIGIDKKTKKLKINQTNAYKKALITFELDYLFTIKKPNHNHKREIAVKKKRIQEIERYLYLPIPFDMLVDKYNRDKEIEEKKTKLELKTFIEFFFDVKEKRKEDELTGQLKRCLKGKLKAVFKDM